MGLLKPVWSVDELKENRNVILETLWDAKGSRLTRNDIELLNTAFSELDFLIPAARKWRVEEDSPDQAYKKVEALDQECEKLLELVKRIRPVAVRFETGTTTLIGNQRRAIGCGKSVQPVDKRELMCWLGVIDPANVHHKIPTRKFLSESSGKQKIDVAVYVSVKKLVPVYEAITGRKYFTRGQRDSSGVREIIVDYQFALFIHEFVKPYFARRLNDNRQTNTKQVICEA